MTRLEWLPASSWRSLLGRSTACRARALVRRVAADQSVTPPKVDGGTPKKVLMPSATRVLQLSRTRRKGRVTRLPGAA